MTGYSDNVNRILQAELNRKRDRLDDEIEVMATVHRYNNGELEGVETKTIEESQLSETRRQEGIRKYLGVLSR